MIAHGKAISDQLSSGSTLYSSNAKARCFLPTRVQPRFSTPRKYTSVTGRLFIPRSSALESRVFRCRDPSIWRLRRFRIARSRVRERKKESTSTWTPLGRLSRTRVDSHYHGESQPLPACLAVQRAESEHLRNRPSDSDNSGFARRRKRVQLAHARTRHEASPIKSVNADYAMT